MANLLEKLSSGLTKTRNISAAINNLLAATDEASARAAIAAGRPMARRTQTFLADGNFTVPSNYVADTLFAYIRGGAGGAASCYDINLNWGGGGGGGQGGLAIKLVLGLSPGEVVPVTIGPAGSTPTTLTTDGGDGGTSSFGSHASATGGAGGSIFGRGGTGGIGIGGDLNLQGESGGSSSVFADSNYAIGGSGGGGPAGAFGPGASATIPGSSGAGGGRDITARLPGTSMPGIIYLSWWEYV